MRKDSRLIVAIIVAGFLLSMVFDVACPKHVEAAQVHPDTWVVRDGQPTVIVVDAPPKGYSDWSLLVRVGETEFAVPRTELRKLAVSHPDWRRQ